MVIAVEVPNSTPQVSQSCRSIMVLDQHQKSLNEAHERLRDHGGKIAELKSVSEHLTGRVSRAETDAVDNHRMLVQLKGSVESLRLAQDSTADAIRCVTAVTQTTHDALIAHVEHSLIRDERMATARIQQAESTTMRLVKITGMLAALFLVAAAVHGLVAGTPLYETLSRLATVWLAK